MKFKKVKSYDNITVKVTHRDLVLIQEALEAYSYTPKNFKEINNKLFDVQQFKKQSELHEAIDKLNKDVFTILHPIDTF